jgi:hypothetical protein
MLAIVAPLVITAVVLMIMVIPAMMNPVVGLATILLILAMPVTVVVIGAHDQR